MAGLVIQNHADSTHTLRLDGRDVTIGRNANCHIVLADETASRQHVRVRCQDQRYYVEDLQSTNGTILNGQRLKQPTLLNHGDRIEFRTGTITYVEDDPRQDWDGPQSSSSADAEQAGAETIADEGKFYSEHITQFDVMLDGILNESSDQHVRLRALIEIIRTVGRAYDADEILRSILESLFAILPQTERGMIFLKEADKGELGLSLVKYRSADLEGATIDPACYSISKQAISDGKAILRRSAPTSPLGNSVLGFAGVSLLCAPLVGYAQDPLGAIYIDTHDMPYSEEDLDLFACIGVLAGQSLEQSRLHAARYRAVVNNAVDGIITIDAQGTIESTNVAATTLFGYQLDELIGENIARLMPLPDGGRHGDYLKRYLSTGQARILGGAREVIGRRKNGSTFPMYLSIGEFELAGHKHFTGIIHDITERKQAEDALRASRDRLSRVLQTDVVGIALFDAQGRAFESNAAFRRLTGYSLEQVKARRVAWDDLTMPVRKDLRRRASRQLRESGHLGPYESECVRQDDSRVSVILSAARLPAHDGGVGEDEFVAFFVDNTEQKKAEEALKALNESLEQRVRARTEYIRLLHDVAVIANNAESVTEALQSALDRIRRCIAWPVGRVFLLEDRLEGSLDLLEIWSADAFDGLDALKGAFAQSGLNSGAGVLAEILETKRHRWCGNIVDRLGPQLGQTAVKAGIRSVFAIPILLGSQVCGVLELYSDRSKPPEPALLEVTTNIGTQLGRVVERRRLQQELIDAVWQQQKRFGQELHDTLGQELGGIRMMADSLRWKLESKNAPEAATITELIDLIQHVQDGVRRLSKGLFPVEVDREGLMAALEELAETISLQGQTTCLFRCQKGVEVPNNDVSTHLFRIAQEATNNALRHGKATRIDVILTATAEKLILRIIDNGAGIRVSENRSRGGMGQRIMRYRAGVLGGTFDIGPSGEGGTLVTCTIPKGDGDAER